jgi:hypothetical protein
MIQSPNNQTFQRTQNTREIKINHGEHGVHGA